MIFCNSATLIPFSSIKNSGIIDVGRLNNKRGYLVEYYSIYDIYWIKERYYEITNKTTNDTDITKLQSEFDRFLLKYALLYDAHYAEEIFSKYDSQEEKERKRFHKAFSIWLEQNNFEYDYKYNLRNYDFDNNTIIMLYNDKKFIKMSDFIEAKCYSCSIAFPNYEGRISSVYYKEIIFDRYEKIDFTNNSVEIDTRNEYYGSVYCEIFATNKRGFLWVEKCDPPIIYTVAEKMTRKQIAAKLKQMGKNVEEYMEKINALVSVTI